MQAFHPTRNSGRQGGLDLDEHTAELTAGNNIARILITRIFTTNVATGLNCIPIGFYVAVNTEIGIKRTSNKPALVGRDMVEWDDRIVLPKDRSSRISLTVFAASELGPTLGNGEALCEFEATVGELLGHQKQPRLIRSVPHSDEGSNSSSLSCKIEIERRVYRHDEYMATSNPLESEETRRLGELTDMGHLALTRYRKYQEQGDLDESISYFQHALNECPPNHLSRATVLFNLATAKLIHCRMNDAPADLCMSIDLYRGALRLRPLGHPDHPSTLLSLGVALLAQFQRQYNEADGTEGKSLLSQVLDVATMDNYTYCAAALALRSVAISKDFETMRNGEEFQRLDTALKWILHANSCRHVSFDHLGILFCIRFDHLGDLGDSDKAISTLEVIVQITSNNHPNKPLWLISFGILLSSRYERRKDRGDLDKSILVLGDVVRLIPDSNPGKPLRLSILAGSLFTRYERFGDIADLKRSLSLREDAVKLAHDGDPDKPLHLNNFGRVLLTRYERLGDVADLERSISLLKEAVRLTPDGKPLKLVWLNNLGNSLLARYRCLRDVTDLERSISVFEEVAKLTPDGRPDDPLRLNNLGESLLTRYECLGNVTDLGRSISLLEDAVRLTSDGQSQKPVRLNNLGSSLSARYRRFGDVADLERSISVFEEVIKFIPDGRPDKPLGLNNLGESLVTRYKLFGDIADLKRSISMFEDVVKLTPDGHPDKPLRLGNLGSSLLTRYNHVGDATDLERSTSMSWDVVKLTPDGHPHKPLRLNNLGSSLSTRYRRFGDVTDLERATSAFEDAVKLARDGDPNKPLYLNNFGRMLSTRYERLGNVADLGISISLLEDAVRPTTDGQPRNSVWLNNLGNSLLTRYNRFGNVADLERSISVFEEAVKLTRDGHADKPLQLNNLGDSLLARYRRCGDIASLKRSIAVLKDAVQLTPDGHLAQSSRLNGLAFSLLERSQCSGSLSSSDISQAMSYSSRAARSQLGLSIDRFDASQLWIRCIRLLRHDYQSLVDPYTITVELLPQLAWLGLLLPDRYHRLLLAADCARDAAATALDVNKPSLAVEWLEQGRSVIWSQLSQLRTPVDDLLATHPELAAQFERVSCALEQASIRDGETGEGGPTQRHALALSRERLLAEIRALSGHERFLLPKTITQLSFFAHPGPVVFLNASEHRCDALVVVADSKHFIHVPLSNINYDIIQDMQLRLNNLLRLKGRVPLRDDLNRGARIRGMTPDDVFGSILTCLWESVVSPILEVLPPSSPDCKLPRIFWCPTGPFSFLPIHAAGVYNATNPGPKLADFVISSYIPTMSALELPLQEESKTTSRSIRLLAVPQPSTDGQGHLSGVRGEIEIVRELASSSPFVGFEEADGTVEDVLSKMAETDWVHFACHGTQDRTNPYDSGFLLAHGKRLKLADIAQLSRPHGGLAFLSACNTATGDQQLSEEAIHIAGGMLLAGYRGVIATMWSILDNDAPRVTEGIYKRLFGNGRAPDCRIAAEALHDAVGRLRDSGVPFLSWVPFIHVGL